MLGLLAACAAQAATLTVTTSAEAATVDSRQCSAGACTTLRDAINVAASGDTIVFAPSLDGQAIALSLWSPFPAGRAAFGIAGTHRELTIDAAQGLESGIRIERAADAAPFRLFDVGVGSMLTLRGLALAQGDALGGGSSFGGGGLGAGGAIFNRGYLFVDRCTFFANRARGGNAGDPLEGLYGGGGMDDFARSGSGGGSNGGDAGTVGYAFDDAIPPDGDYAASDGGPGGAGGFGGGGGRGGEPGSSAFDGGDGGAGGFGGGGGMASGIHGQAKGGAGGFGGGAGGSIFNGEAGVPGGFGGGTSYGGAGSGNGGAGAGMGGAIFNDAGRVVISNSTFAGNMATGGAADAQQGRGSGFGGAIFNHAGDLELLYVTLAGNSAAAGANGRDGLADGGAIYSLADGGCAAGGNSCATGGAARLDMDNSIVAGNGGSGVRDVVAAMHPHNGGTRYASGAGNLVASQDGWTGGIVSSADPQLGTLAGGGGLASVMIPDAGSPVIDQASTCVGSGYRDQRGVTRPQGATCDIGAVEVALPPQAFVGSVTVTTTVDQVVVDGWCSLREAVGMVNGSGPHPDCPVAASDYNRIGFSLPEGDRTILLGEGTLTFQAIASVVVDGADAAGLVLDGDILCHHAVALAQGAQVAMLHLGLRRGGACDPVEVDGGTIVNDGSLALYDVRINEGRSNGNGGAIANRGWLGIADSELTDNFARHQGGAIHSTGTLELYRVRMSGAYSNQGGAVMIADGSAHVVDSRFDANQAEGGGGALRVLAGASLDVSGSSFVDNLASDQVNDTARGGAIASEGTLWVANSTFTRNHALGRGGAIHVGAGQATVATSTLSGNEAVDIMQLARDGGAFSVEGGSLVVQASIAVDNGGNCHGTLVDGGGNLAFLDSTCAGFADADPRLGALADNGGATPTLLPATGSAAIDAVDCDGLPSTDQRGLARPQGSRCDIGAVEVAALTALQVVVSGNGTVDAAPDPAPLDGAIVACGETGGTSCEAGYAQGAVVTLVAQAGADASFAGWSGDGCTDAGDGSASVLVDLARACTATFEPDPTPVAIEASLSTATSVFGQPVSVDVRVQPAVHRPMPTGSVDIVIDGVAYALPLDENGRASATSDLASIGSHAITVSYAGDGASLPAGPVDLVLQVAPAATTVAIDPPPPAAIALGAPIEVFARVDVVAPGHGEPAGTIVVSDDEGNSCSYTIGLLASCMLVPAHAGERTITAHYAGNDEFQPATSAAVQVGVFGEESLKLTVSDDTDFAPYGSINVYEVRVGNLASSGIARLSLAGAASAALDAEAGAWCELDGASECTPLQQGPFAIAGTSLVAHEERAWLVSIPVRTDAPGDTADYTVTLQLAEPATTLVRSDSDRLVLFRDGFD